MRRILLFFVTVFLLMGIRTYAYDFESNGICYTINSDGESVSVTSWEANYYGDISIPSSIKYNEKTYSVTSIGDRAFYYCSSLTSITIPNSVMSIGEYAFAGCKGLTFLRIPDGTLGIGRCAFRGCVNLRSIILPFNEIWIGDYAFDNCSSLSLVVSYQIRNIYYNPFSRNSIDFDHVCLYVPAGMKQEYIYAGWGVFNNIIDASESPNDSGRFGRFGDDAAWAYFENSKLLVITSRWKIHLDGSVGSLMIHEDIESIVIEEGVKSIDSGLSKFQNLDFVSFPSTLEWIGDGVFCGCTKLSQFFFPNGLRRIGNAAFSGCQGLTSVFIPASIEELGMGVFAGWWNIESIKVDDSNIRYDSRDNCNAIIETSTNTLITGCKNTVIPNSVTSIGDHAFESCYGLTSITIPSSVTSVGNYAFYYCSGLTSIIIPSSVTSIGDWAFSDCSGLTSITIPNSVTNIGNSAFAYCKSIKDVISEIQNPFEISENVFYSSTYTNAVLTIPAGTKSAYQSTAGWKRFSNIVQGGSDEGGCGDDGDIGNDYEDVPGTAVNLGLPSGTRWSDCNIGADKDDIIGDYLTWGAIKMQEQYSVPNYIWGNSSDIGGMKYLGTYTDLADQKTNSYSIAGTQYDAAYIRWGWNWRLPTQQEINELVDVCIWEWTSRTDTKHGMVLGYEVTGPTGKSIFLPAAGYMAQTGNSPELYRLGESGFYWSDYIFYISTFMPDNIIWQENWSLVKDFKINPQKYNANYSFTGMVLNDDGTFKSGTTFYNENLAGGTAPELLVAKNGGSFTAKVAVNGVSGEAILSFKCNKKLDVTVSGATIGDVTSAGNDYSYPVTIAEGTTEITITFTMSSNANARLDNIKLYLVGAEDQNNKNAYALQFGQGINREIKQLKRYIGIPIRPVDGPVYSTNILSISSTSGGSVHYSGKEIKGSTQRFPINGGGTAIFYIWPNVGYTIKSVKVDGVDISANVANNRCTISNIIQNTNVEVEFEAIPPTTYTLSITATGNGNVSYNGTTVRNNTSRLNVVEGSNATIIITPDNGYRMKSVKVNGSDVTSLVSGNQYAVSNITKNTTIEVVFEKIPQTYSLTITASGNGYVNYLEASIAFSKSTKEFTITEGSTATLAFTPNNGFRLKSVVVNGTDVTANVVNNRYAISNITKNTTIEVLFEKIPQTYSLTITASGNGYVNYLEASIAFSNSTKEFTITEGSTATLTFTPNSGYRVGSIKVNGTVIGSNLNSYTISAFNQNITVEVEFEEIPSVTYTLTISSTAGGYVAYAGNTIHETTWNYSVVKGTSVTLTFTPNNGYRLKSVVVNGTDVTANVVNNQYTINNISRNTTIEVEFEEIPLTTYTLSITAEGNGYVTYVEKSIAFNKTTKEFTVTEGSDVTLAFSPMSGYRVKSVVVNGTVVTTSVSNNRYAISNINKNTSVIVSFEEIPPTTYSLTITAVGNGYASYNGTNVRGTSSVFTVVEGTSATITFVPDEGHRIKSVSVNGTDVTANITSNQYTISSISRDMTIGVVFEKIPPKTYTLSITAEGNGSVSYHEASASFSKTTKEFAITEGSSATLTFTPNDGYRLKSVVVNGVDVTASVTNNQYTISNISQNTTVDVTFEEELKEMTIDGVNYRVTSYNDKTVNVAAGNYGTVLSVPYSFVYNGPTWTVRGIDNGALANAKNLAAIIWNPKVAFTEKMPNPNLLLYVNSASYAPSSVKNVIVDNVAQEVVLSDDGGNFYCPKEFTARTITYTHNYSMPTGGKGKGWETLALPFDVQKVEHKTKGVLTPFALYTDEMTQRPFWLYELGANGFKRASAVKANMPYIISMPNSTSYDSQYILAGNVTFSASNVRVAESKSVVVHSSGNKQFVPAFSMTTKSQDIYPMNVNNNRVSYSGSYEAGSKFISNLRDVLPFEAYMTTSSSSRYLNIEFDNEATDIDALEAKARVNANVEIYSIGGMKIVKTRMAELDKIWRELPAGVYIVNGKKHIK